MKPVDIWRQEVRIIFLSVQHMIEQEGFADFQTLAGAGGLPTREVKTICVIDTLDLAGWVFGGEFLLSSGLIFRDNPDLLESVIETASRPVAAALSLHYNTVKYRYRKISEILGTDLESSPVRTSLALAMELYLLDGSERGLYHGA